jgi:hypothetical protein
MPTKSKPIHTLRVPRKTVRKTHVEDDSLKSLLLRIAERGKLIPPEEQDKISREMREQNYCSGSGPVLEL